MVTILPRAGTVAAMTIEPFRIHVPDDVLDVLVANEIGASGVIGRDHAARIAQLRGEREIEGTARIDFVDGHQCAIAHFAAHHLVRARSGKHQTDGNGRLRHATLGGWK